MSDRKLSRRAFLAAASTALAGAVLSACGGTPTAVPTQKPAAAPPTAVPPTPAPKTPVTIKYQTVWNVGTPNDIVTPAVQMFNDKFGPNLKAELVAVPAVEASMLTAMAGGTAPDVYHYGPDPTGLYARGVIQPLDDLIGGVSGFDPNIYLPEQWAGETWNGKKMGIPALEGSFLPAFIWNKKLVQEAGLDPEKPPTTWDEIRSWASKLTKKDTSGNIVQLGFDSLDAAGSLVQQWCQVADAAPIDQDKRKFSFDQEKLVKALELVATFWKDAGVEKVSSLAQQWAYWLGPANSGFGNGARALVLDGAWAPGQLKNVAKDKTWQFGYTWAPCLTNPGKKFLAFGGHREMMPKSCKIPAEAIKLMTYLTSLEVALKEFDVRGIACYSKPFVEKADLKRFAGLEWYFTAPKEASELWSLRNYSSPLGGQAQTLWNRATQEAIYGTKTAAQALKDINTELQKSLDDFYAAQKA